MTREWLLVVLVGTTTMLLKGAGPVLMHGRGISPATRPVLARVAPALFGALAAAQSVSLGGSVVADARLAGVAVAILCAALRLPPIVTLASAVGVTAALRHLLA